MTHPVIVAFPRPEANTAAVLTIGNLPALTGSDKQIAWATDIRAKLAREVADMAAKAAGVAFGVVLRSDVDFIADVETRIATALATTPGADRFAAAADRLFGRADAKYWIDNRNAPAIALIRDNG